jgi:hypothetical protein
MQTMTSVAPPPLAASLNAAHFPPFKFFKSDRLIVFEVRFFGDLAFLLCFTFFPLFIDGPLLAVH